jgi:hypothetical protein
LSLTIAIVAVVAGEVEMAAGGAAVDVRKGGLLKGMMAVKRRREGEREMRCTQQKCSNKQKASPEWVVTECN